MKEIRMYEDPTLVRPGKADGWVTPDGYWHHNEDAARFSACTHRQCRYCGTAVDKGWLACESCRDKQDQEKWDAAEKKPWDGMSIVYSDKLDKYFTDMDDIVCHLENDSEDGSNPVVDAKELRLYHCDPVFLSSLDTEHWVGDFPGEEHDTPDGVEELVDAINALIEKHNKESWPASWEQSKIAVQPETL